MKLSKFNFWMPLVEFGFALLFVITGEIETAIVFVLFGISMLIWDIRTAVYK